MFRFGWNKSPLWDKENEGGAATDESGGDPTYSEEITTGSENAGAPKEVSDDDDSAFFEDLISDDDEEEEKPQFTSTRTSTEPTAEESTEDSDPKTEDKPEVIPEDTPKPEAIEPTVKPEETPQVPQTEAPEPQETREDLNARYEEFFKKSVETLEAQVYQFDDEMKDTLDTEPSKVLPKLAAQLHMQVLTAATTQIANMLPGMMAVMNERSNIGQQRQDKLLTDYPELKGHEKDLVPIAQVMRQLNPNDTFEQLAPKIAAAAKVQLQLFDSPASQQPLAQRPVTPTAVKGGSTPPAAPSLNQPTQWDELIAEED